MPRYISADDAALWGEGDWDVVPSAAAPHDPSPPPVPERTAIHETPTLKPVPASLTQIQVLIETLRETRLDAMQQELAVFLLEAAALMRCELLGETPPPPEHRPSLFEELDVEDVELIDDQSPEIQTSPATQDYLDFEFDDDLCDAPDAGEDLMDGGLDDAGAQDADFLDDLDIIECDTSDYEAAPARVQPEAPQKSGPLAQLRFLVADDNPAQLSATRALLEGLGADCHVCNCAEAAQLARMGGWEAILIDIHMHTRDGIATVREIRGDEASEHKHRTPLFVMAGTMNPDQMRECLAAGADGHVAKPLSEAAVTDQFAVLSLERSLGQGGGLD